LLKDKSNVPRSRRIAGYVATVDEDRAGIGTFETGDQPKRRRLASAART